eukprot:Nk52_evm3s326 gene=Nk52_evmTU3s326
MDQDCVSKSSNSVVQKVFRGVIIHCVRLGGIATVTNKLEYLPQGCLGLNPTGKIVFCCDVKELAEKEKMFGFAIDNVEVHQLKNTQMLIPGFIDTHCHAPQFPNLGIGLDLPLLEWLQQYTFPTEAKIKDLKYAQDVYNKVVLRSLACGTTTCSYFGSIHKEGTLLLAELCFKYGQRAFVGKVNMDTMSPNFYCEESGDSFRKTVEFVDVVNSKGYGTMIYPVLTPRFAVSCTEGLMKQLGEFAASHRDIPIQTHLGETIPECQLIQDMFPNSDSYTHVYDKCGLLGSKTILAHCNYMSDEELKLIASRGASISHCPNSNFSLGSGVCSVKKILQFGIKTGLGTDVSGGTSPCILDSIRLALVASKMTSLKEKGAFSYDPTENFNENLKNPKRRKSSLSFYEEKASSALPHLSLDEAFYLSNLGGAEALGLDHITGNFEAGKEFDALVVDLSPSSLSTSEQTIHIFEKDTLKDKLQKFLICGDDRNIVGVYTQGQLRDLKAQK